jgi:hypothetical protein
LGTWAFKKVLLDRVTYSLGHVVGGGPVEVVGGPAEHHIGVDGLACFGVVCTEFRHELI